MDQHNPRLWDDMLDEFRALGGSADNICLKDGPYGRGLFPRDVTQPVSIHIPPSLLVEMKYFELDKGEVRINPAAEIGARERQFLEDYERDFAWGTGRSETEQLLQMVHEAPQELRRLLDTPFNISTWLKDPTPEVLLERFLSSRVIHNDKKKSIVMPILELTNHGEEAYYDVREDGVSLKGQFSGEILVSYNKCDPLDMFANWGFASNEPFALSLPMGFQGPAGTLLIAREDTVEAPIHKRFFPTVSSPEGDKLTLSYVLLGHKKYPRLARSIFYKVMRDAGRPHPEVAFDQIQHMNRLRLLELMDASEIATPPLGRLLRKVARYQLEAMSYSVGTRDV